MRPPPTGSSRSWTQRWQMRQSSPSTRRITPWATWSASKLRLYLTGQTNATYWKTSPFYTITSANCWRIPMCCSPATRTRIHSSTSSSFASRRRRSTRRKRPSWTPSPMWYRSCRCSRSVSRWVRSDWRSDWIGDLLDDVQLKNYVSHFCVGCAQGEEGRLVWNTLWIIYMALSIYWFMAQINTKNTVHST